MVKAPGASARKSSPPAAARPLSELRLDPRSPYDETLGPPAWWKVALEARAPWELAALVASLPWLRKLPAGDGHPVIVFPGLGVGDFSTLPLRRFLLARGYDARPWHQGFNFGPRSGVLAGCMEQLRGLHREHGQQVSLIGWSLGGIYARELAKEVPELVRCVITLGSPFAGHPRATNAWRLFELVSGQSAHDPQIIDTIRTTPSVPTTSLYSRTDGIVAWPCSLNPRSSKSENIEIAASHMGMAMNPVALYAVADRLAQDPDHWQPFAPQGVPAWFSKQGLAPSPVATMVAPATR
jgi:pimeloyl-ACP methyl ester carboxylesterase